MILVDTSVWIAVFRKKPAFRIEDAVEFDEIVTCLPVIQEVLQGFREERAYRIARDAMTALPIVESPLEEPLFIEAAELSRTARRQGLTIRSSVDCLIAACALRHDLPVLHMDRDYELLSRVSALATRPVHKKALPERLGNSSRILSRTTVSPLNPHATPHHRKARHSPSGCPQGRADCG